jgi:hypothetical protein
MPPRFAYWTILIDNAPTAFRAQQRDELAPTLHQLQRKNPTAVMKWFARGRLWESRDEEQAAWRAKKSATRDRGARHQKMDGRERRGKDWRPGGQHRDPRARFQAGKNRRRKPPASGSATKGRHAPPHHREPRPHPGERPPRRHDRPERRERERPAAPRPDVITEPPPAAEQIVIKPEPPERGSK